jgi:hypothetical protein
MRCFLFIFFLVLIAVVHAEDLYRARRSLASGRWGLRPGKRSISSIVEPEIDAATLDELRVAGKLSDRFRRNLATGRWGMF